jgi:hypothetical protein
MVTHIVTHYKKLFDSLDYVPVFRELLLKYEQGLETVQTVADAGSTTGPET